MAGGSATPAQSGDALFAFDPDLTIVSWNRAAEELTGVSADDAVGRKCFDVLGGHNDRGDLVCHQGCSTARLAREGWPVTCQGVLVTTRKGGRPVHLSTIALGEGEQRLFLHVLVPRTVCRGPTLELLTTRQHEVLQLLAEGCSAKLVAGRLGIAQATVRSHIRAILVALDSHSQLEALAKARSLQLIG
jgi:PAS domain S-box-containing protein